MGLILIQVVALVAGLAAIGILILDDAVGLVRRGRRRRRYGRS